MVKLRLGCGTFRSASTVSPAIAIWPSATRGACPPANKRRRANRSGSCRCAGRRRRCRLRARTARSAAPPDRRFAPQRSAAAGGGNDERVAFVALARLVEIGADEGAGPIDHAVDAPGDRAAIDVTIEDAHEDRNANERPRAEIELRRRHCIGDAAHASVGRRDHNASRASASPASDRGRNRRTTASPP